MTLSFKHSSMTEGKIIHFPNNSGKSEKNSKSVEPSYSESLHDSKFPSDLPEGLDLINETKREILRTIEIGFKLQDKSRTLEVVNELLKNF